MFDFLYIIDELRKKMKKYDPIKIEEKWQKIWDETQESLFLVNTPGDSDVGTAQITF